MLTCAVIITLIVNVEAYLESFITIGSFAPIERYPHSVYTIASCLSQTGPWSCGASVLNNLILLTAAHCLNGCKSRLHVIARLGEHTGSLASKRTVNGYISHEKFNDITFFSDIAILRIRAPVTSTNNMNRVTLMKNPPYDDLSYIAGWGLLENEPNPLKSRKLKHIDLKVLPTAKCEKYTKKYLMLRTILCASTTLNGYQAVGDSGSALMVRGNTQIGLVSYSRPEQYNISIYTNVAWFYDWIQYQTRRLYCHKKKDCVIDKILFTLKGRN